MHHRRRRIERELYDLVRGRTTEVRKETDPARIMFFERIGRGGIRDRDGAVVRDGANLAMELCS